MAATSKKTSTETTTSDKPRPKVKRVTVDGLTLTIDPRVIEDFRVQRALVSFAGISNNEVENDPKLLATFFNTVERVLGSNYDALLVHIESKNDGYAPTGDVIEAFMQVIQKVAPNS